jgi:hypothetical protein
MAVPLRACRPPCSVAARTSLVGRASPGSSLGTCSPATPMCWPPPAQTGTPCLQPCCPRAPGLLGLPRLGLAPLRSPPVGLPPPVRARPPPGPPLVLLEVQRRAPPAAPRAGPCQCPWLVGAVWGAVTLGLAPLLLPVVCPLTQPRPPTLTGPALWCLWSLMRPPRTSLYKLGTTRTP